MQLPKTSFVKFNSNIMHIVIINSDNFFYCCNQEKEICFCLSFTLCMCFRSLFSCAKNKMKILSNCVFFLSIKITHHILITLQCDST